MPNSLEEFKQKVIQNPALSEQFKTVSSPEEFANLAVQMGQQLGYSFTVDEVQAALTEASPDSQELTSTQMEAIAGGILLRDTLSCSTPNYCAE